MTLLVARQLQAGHDRALCAPLDFELAPGETLGLRGPNGAGKTTLLRTLTGQIPPFAGSVTRRPGLRFAVQAQHPHRPRDLPLSARDYLALLGAPAEAPADIAALFSKRIDRLSGGQFQLLHLWALLSTPGDILALDEPTNNLDPQRIDRLLELLAQRRPGVAALVVSHDADFLERTGARVLTLEPS